MRKLWTFFVAVVIILSNSACSVLKPVNGYEAIKVRAPYDKYTKLTWFQVDVDDLVNTLNQQGVQNGYPELVVKDTCTSYTNLVWAERREYSLGKAENPSYVSIDYGIETDDPYSLYSAQCIVHISIKTDIEETLDAQAIGYYTDLIIGMFSPRNKDKIEDQLKVFEPVEATEYITYTCGNVLYSRNSDSFWIKVDEDATPLYTYNIEESSSSAPSLIKPE